MIRIARPGPGKGCRQTIRSGIPSSSPTRRTSSLKRRRSGSTSSILMSAGKPPTLWCDLIFAATPSVPPDSITSEYSVPWPRNRTREAVEEVLQHLLAVRRVHDLRVELDAVQSALARLEGGDRRRRRPCHDACALRRRDDRVSVRHPDRLLRRHAFEKAAPLRGHR